MGEMVFLFFDILFYALLLCMLMYMRVGCSISCQYGILSTRKIPVVSYLQDLAG